MTAEHVAVPPAAHSHVFLGAGHAGNERRTWSVVWLCGAMMLLEIVGGSIFGSLALPADQPPLRRSASRWRPLH